MVCVTFVAPSDIVPLEECVLGFQLGMEMMW